MNSIKYKYKIIAKICIIAAFCIVMQASISKAGIYSNDPTATTNSTVAITVSSSESLDNFNMDVSNSGGLIFSSVSAKDCITNGTAVGYMTLNNPVTTLGTYIFKTPSTPGEYTVTFVVNGKTNTSKVKVVDKSTESSQSSQKDETTTADKDKTATSNTTKSSVATLANLGIKPNDFSGFKPNTTSYSTEVPNDVETIEIYASKGQSGQTITGTGKKNLKEGTNTFEISVTAEDGKTKKTYTLNITRKTNEEEKDKKDETETETEEGEEEPIDIFGLSELKIKNLKLSPQFQTDIYEYKIELTEDIDKLDISTVATDVNSNIEITGNEQLEEGENIITILVTGEDGEKSAAYQIIVNKKTTTIEDVENEDKYDMKKIIIIAGAGALTLIVVILIIVKVIKNKKDNQYYDDDYEEYDDYEDEDDYNDTEEIDENNDNEDLTTDFINDEPSEDYYKEEKIKKKKRSKGKRFK